MNPECVRPIISGFNDDSQLSCIIFLGINPKLLRLDLLSSMHKCVNKINMFFLTFYLYLFFFCTGYYSAFLYSDVVMDLCICIQHEMCLKEQICSSTKLTHYCMVSVISIDCHWHNKSLCSWRKVSDFW